MGNSQGRESRAPLSPARTEAISSNAPVSPRPEPASGQDGSGHSRRGDRSTRPDLSFLGIGSSTSGDRDVSILEARRETKQDREARRVEKEKAARLKERERSMKEEHVDGGYLVTQGVYVGTEDYNKQVVRQLMVCLRRLCASFGTDECRLTDALRRFGEA